MGWEDASREIRFRGDVLERLTDHVKRKVEEDLVEFARLGGMMLALSGSPWANSPIVSNEGVQRAHVTVEGLRRHTLPTTLAPLRKASETSGLPTADTLAEWEPRLKLWCDINDTLDSN